MQSPLPKTALTEPAIAGSISTGAVASYRSRIFGLRALLVAGVLFLVPVLAYWPATFHDFGLRDDYSNLREAHEELGKVVAFCASHARPIYGWLLQVAVGGNQLLMTLIAIDVIVNLKWSFPSP